MVTLRTSIGDAINELNKLIRITQNEKELRKLRKVRRIYFDLWQEVIKQNIDHNTSQFKKAIEELSIAHQTALKAKQDEQIIIRAIDNAVKAAKAVDRIVQIGVDIMI